MRSGSILHALEDLAGKRVNQHVARLEVGQAARAQIENRVVVELPDRRAVRALHVVGKDLELRLGVDRRVVRQQQRPVGLLRVGLLRVDAHDDLAVEDRARAAAEDALVDLVARAVRLGVIDRRVRVDQPLAVGQVQAVQRALGAFAVEHRDDVVADDAAAEREGVGRDVAAARGMDVHARDVERVDALFLDLVVIDDRVLAGDDFGHGVGEMLLPRRADVGLDDLHLAAVAGNDERARVRHRRRCDAPSLVDTNRICSGCSKIEAVGHGDEGAVVRERGVERGERARVSDRRAGRDSGRRCRPARWPPSPASRTSCPAGSPPSATVPARTGR